MMKKIYEQAEISIRYFSDDSVIVASDVEPAPTQPEITTESDDMEILPFNDDPFAN